MHLTLFIDCVCQYVYIQTSHMHGWLLCVHVTCNNIRYDVMPPSHLYPQLLSSSWLLSQYPNIYLKSVDCCNDRFLYHHQSTNRRVMWSVNSTYFVDVNSLNEIELHKRVLRSRILYLQVLVWTQSSSMSNHRRYVTTMAVNLPPHAMLWRWRSSMYDEYPFEIATTFSANDVFIRPSMAFQRWLLSGDRSPYMDTSFGRW